MTILEAEKFARNKTLKATGIILTILIVIFLFGETAGDFANGIVFFMAALLNIHSLIILIILFGLTYFFAGQAGKEIIIEKKNFLIVALKYVILISLTISTYLIFIGLSKENDFTYSGFEKIMATYFLPLFIKTAISLLIVWLWATNKMKSALLKALKPPR